MQEMGINAVRTYESIVDKNVLDTLWKRGIWVVNSVYNWGGADADSAAEPVKATKDHPAILMVVKKYDNGLHPIASIYGDVGRDHRSEFCFGSWTMHRRLYFRVQ
eukprot:g18553.t1